MKYTQIQIDDIPGLEVVGYYWYSCYRKPKVIVEPRAIDRAWFKNLPFIVEANFYASKEKVSIRVQYIDGQYHIVRYDLDGLNGDESIYIGHDLEGLNYKMFEYWEEVEDPFLENMKTLQPAWTAFCGFTDNKN